METNSGEHGKILNNDVFASKRGELKRLQKDSLENRDKFWSSVASRLVWTKTWDKVCDVSDAPITKWFTGGEMNVCYNCLDIHVERGLGEREAMYFDSPVTSTRLTYTFNQLLDQVTRLAGVLREYEVGKGDVVMIYFPMMVEGVVAMLASCRMGSTHCAIPSGLPAHDLAIRIDHAKPKVILCASRGYTSNGPLNYKDILDEACSKATHKPNRILVLNRVDKINVVEGRDEDWVTKLNECEPMLECVPMEATEPLFAIYTSGSTGEPKAIVHSVGYAVKVLLESDIFYKDNPGNETIFATTNFGWIVSHSCLVYTPLISGNKALIYEGDHLLTEDPNELYRVITDNGITKLMVRTGIIKFLKAKDPYGKIAAQHNLKSLSQVYTGGERADQATLKWAADTFSCVLNVFYGQTELCFMTGCGDYSSLKTSRRVFTSSEVLPGIDLVIMKSDNSIAKAGEVGRILARIPLPPGGLSTLLGDHQKCKTTYFGEYPGYFDTKDEGFFDENENLVIECRADDIMKHQSIYLSAQGVEQIVSSHADVAECLVVAISDSILKDVPIILFVIKNDSSKSLESISEEIIEMTSKHYGVAVKFGKAIPVRDLPRTRTGKVHRASVAALAKKQSVKNEGAIDNPEVLQEIASALKTAGY